MNLMLSFENGCWKNYVLPVTINQDAIFRELNLLSSTFNDRYLCDVYATYHVSL